MHIIPVATKLALVKHTNRYPGEFVLNVHATVHANVSGYGVTVTFAPDIVLAARQNRPTTATYFVSLEEIREDGKKWRI